MEGNEMIIAMFVIALILFFIFIKVVNYYKNKNRQKKKQEFQLSNYYRPLSNFAGVGTGTGAEPLVTQCTPIPIGSLLTNQLKDIIPALINGQLTTAGPINLSTPVPDLKLTITMSSATPLQMDSLIFDPFNSNICGNTLTIVGRVVFHTDGVLLKLFAEEKLDTILLQADLTMKMQLLPSSNSPALQVTSISLSNLTINTPSRVDISFIIAMTIPYVLGYINEELKNIIKSTIPLPQALKVSNNELTNTTLLKGDMTPSVETAIIDFLTRQLNGVIKSSLVSSLSFKVCSTCLPSTINNIQLGRTVYTEDSGCGGVNLPFGIGCAGCSWGYRAGVNSIRGLGNMQIQKLILGQVKLVNRTTVRVFFSLDVSCNGVTIYVQSQVKPCSGGYIGFTDLGVPVPGTVNIKLIDAYVDGSYDSETKMSNFNTSRINISNVHLSLNIPTGWVKIDTGSSVVDAILSPIISVIANPATGLFQTTINAIIKSSLDGAIGGVLQDIVGKIPSVSLPIAGLTPSPIVERRKDAGNDCGWADHPRGYYNAIGRPSGEKLDYCRFVGNKPDIWFSCALAGTTDQYTDRNDPVIAKINPSTAPHDPPVPGDSCYGRV